MAPSQHRPVLALIKIQNSDLSMSWKELPRVSLMDLARLLFQLQQRFSAGRGEESAYQNHLQGLLT